MKMICITLVALYSSVGFADVYLHVPRGSNNRANEKSANRNNGNRAFDSQNNNRGGYNIGEFGDTNGFNNDNGAYATDEMMFDYANTDWAGDATEGKKQFEETFLENSLYQVTWTAQHGCGNGVNNCNFVLEYTCDTHPQDVDVLDPDYTADASAANRQGDFYQQNKWWRDYDTVTGWGRVQLKNGRNTNTPDDPNNIGNSRATHLNNHANGNFQAESEEFYAMGKKWERNKGLFTADQKLQGDDATKTRQNPGGTRRGLEVPEERDYFPYWRPTPWRAAAIIHNSQEECEDQMQRWANSVNTKGGCYPSDDQVEDSGESTLNAIVRANTPAECATATGQWVNLQYDIPAPECVKASWSQANNLGNIAGTDDGGLPQNWDWNIPSMDEFKASRCYVYRANEGGSEQDYVRIQMRMRYNISTMDYAPYTTDATCNQGPETQSPVEQNPTVNVGVEMQGLKLAINTAQTGRTFQDRSHVIRIMRRITQGSDTVGNKVVKNVVIQGKRGNIVQTYPAVEYDFWPKKLSLKVGECASFQWTGSNTHNNGNPAGDGQAGDAGEGRGGSDRSNFVQLMDKNSTYPAPLDKPVFKQIWNNAKFYKTYTGERVKTGCSNPPCADGSIPTAERDAQFYFASGGYYNAESEVNNTPNNDDRDGQLNVLLNNAPASMRSMTMCPVAPGTFYMVSTRNNNFSNRDQKFTVEVTN